nr:SDR family oxidoreductase [Sphingomonas sp. CDS-1]
MTDLSKKIALISGGASGLGAASARAIVAAGGRVVIADIAQEAGGALAEELSDRALYVPLDVTNAEQWRGAVEAAVTSFGGLNILVNSAGVVDGGPLGDFSLDRWRRVVDTNLTGTFLGMSAAVDALKAAGSASIINISSVAGLQGTAGFHAYCASKFGIRGLTKSAALELAPFGVRVNSVHPGTIRTPMTMGVPASMAQFCAMQRFGEAEEIADLVVFLASDRSSFSTGAEFVADGGESAGAVRDLSALN